MGGMGREIPKDISGIFRLPKVRLPLSGEGILGRGPGGEDRQRDVGRTLAHD